MAVSDDLRRAIKESDLSLSAIAAGAGVSLSAVWRFAEGKRSLNLPAVDALCKFFQMRLTRPVKPKV